MGPARGSPDEVAGAQRDDVGLIAPDSHRGCALEHEEDLFGVLVDMHRGRLAGSRMTKKASEAAPSARSMIRSFVCVGNRYRIGRRVSNTYCDNQVLRDAPGCHRHRNVACVSTPIASIVQQ